MICSNWSMLMVPAAMYFLRSAFTKVSGSIMNLVAPLTWCLDAVILTSVRMVCFFIVLDVSMPMDAEPEKHPYDPEILTAAENESLAVESLLTLVMSESDIGRGTMVTSPGARSKIDGPMLTKYGCAKSTTKQLASVSQGFTDDMIDLVKGKITDPKNQKTEGQSTSGTSATELVGWGGGVGGEGVGLSLLVGIWWGWQWPGP